MNIEKFYTREVQIYEKVRELNSRIDALKSNIRFISQNYDSKITVTIEASSYHNYNDKTLKTISLPVDVILGKLITEDFVLEKLDAEIKSIKEQLKELNTEFENLSK